MFPKFEVKREAEIIDLTVDDSESDGDCKFSVGNTKVEDTGDIIILDTHYTPIKVEPRGCKRSASPIELPEKQRLRLEISNSGKKDNVLKVKDLLKLFKPKGKKAIANMVLSDDVVEKRFEPFGGLKEYKINLTLAELDMMVSRLFMASVYGGNSQETFPSIGQEKLARHGMNDFMYVHMDYQPCGPQIPGRPGVWFSTHSDSPPFVARVLTRDLKLAMWQYVGQYDVRPAESLTKEEWLEQKPTVKNTWARQLCKKKWGRWFCSRVQARKEVGRKPTNKKVDEVFKNGRFANVTPDDVMAALNSGQERIAVWTMNCVGYDEAFQIELREKFPQWTPPKVTQSKKPRKNTKKRVKKESKTPVKRPGKRHLEQEIDSDSELDSVQATTEAEYSLNGVDSDSDWAPARR